MAPKSLSELSAAVVDCRRCPRLVEWREQVAQDKRASFRDQVYWGRPVPGFGDARARVIVVGLAPAAHGANRTGRMFTGDRSGDWLYGSLFSTGFASQPTAIHANDGLALTSLWITAAVRCAPPQNKPSPLERDNCGAWLSAELALLPSARVIVCLGQFAYEALWRRLGTDGVALPRPRPRFRHGGEVELDDSRFILTCYHPSQQNTFTGRLTEAMLDAVFNRARDLAGAPPS